MPGRPQLHPVPLRRLVAGPPPAADRIFYHNVWLRGPNSPQIEGLVPRLSRLDCYLTMVSKQWLLRAVQFRALMAASHPRNQAIVGRAGRRYRWMLAHRSEQIAYFPGRIVAQLDDPAFSEKEVALLKRPNVAVFVMTSERAVERFRSMGVDKPSYVLPLGSEVESLSGEAIAAVRRQYRAGRPPDEVVVGYIASTLRLDGDRHAEEALHNVEHLLRLWDEVRARAPKARLWLVGAASERLQQRVAGRDDIALLGTVPQPGALPYVANFDIALYPRAKDQGVRASKIADHMGAGVPTVSYDYEVVGDLRESGAGLLAKTPADFVDAIVRLVDDRAERARLAEVARRAGADRDWRVLIPRFERDVLDVYLA